MELTRVIRLAMSVAGAHGVSAEGSLEAGHGEGGGDAFARDVAESDAEFAVGEGEKIVVVAADAKRGAAAARIIESGDFWQVLRKKALLHFSCDVEFAV